MVHVRGGKATYNPESKESRRGEHRRRKQARRELIRKLRDSRART